MEGGKVNNLLYMDKNHCVMFANCIVEVPLNSFFRVIAAINGDPNFASSLRHVPCKHQNALASLRSEDCEAVCWYPGPMEI